VLANGSGSAGNFLKQNNVKRVTGKVDMNRFSTKAIPNPAFKVVQPLPDVTVLLAQRDQSLSARLQPDATNNPSPEAFRELRISENGERP
jgi:hypothetical protein